MKKRGDQSGTRSASFAYFGEGPVKLVHPVRSKACKRHPLLPFFLEGIYAYADRANKILSIQFL